jgi:hypothetical protein
VNDAVGRRLIAPTEVGVRQDASSGHVITARADTGSIKITPSGA